MALDRQLGRRLWLLAALLGIALAVALVQAMSPEGQTQQLPPALRAQLQQRAATWQGLSTEQQRAFRERQAQWDGLMREQRATRREQYRAWQALEPLDRKRVRAARAHFATLTPEQQRAWHEQFDALDRSVRRGWLLGPRLGADYRGLQPLLQLVPAAQRKPLLDALRAMSPAARADLAVLVQRTPPRQRDPLRRELLATDPAQRDDWLRQKLQE